MHTLLKGLWVMLLAFCSLSVQAGFLATPLSCGDPSCSFQYTQGVYTPLIMNSVLDHSMAVNPNGRYPYKDPTSGSTNGTNGVVIGFNGETASGPRQGTTNSTLVCIQGSILLKPTPSSPANTALTNGSGCGSTSYASYDEHPGYDYKASTGTTVKASAAGVVVNYGGQKCVLNGISTCSTWGYVGIDHGNGYISQYGHLSSIYVAAGASVTQGQTIGLSGDTGVAGSPHLHFEVLKLRSGYSNNYDITNYVVVDPYGWVGTGSDPLYSTSVYGVTPIKLWQ